jgi:hypothetical protein
MTNIHDIADRVEIEALRGEFTDAAMMRDYDRLADLFTYLQEVGRARDGRSEQNFAIYHDRYRRTPDGWRFTERVYEVRYHDTSPLAGEGTSVPQRLA